MARNKNQKGDGEPAGRFIEPGEAKVYSLADRRNRNSDGFNEPKPVEIHAIKRTFPSGFKTTDPDLVRINRDKPPVTDRVKDWGGKVLDSAIEAGIAAYDGLAGPYQATDQHSVDDPLLNRTPHGG